MFQRFSKMDKEELSIIGVSGVLLILIALLFSLLMFSMIEREEVLLRYDAEQILTNYLYRIQSDSISADELLSADSDIRGLGIYLRDGRRMVGMGEVPERLLPEAYEFTEGNFAEYDKDSGHIEYIRRAKLTFTATRLNDGVDESTFDQLEIPVAEYLYISFDGSIYRSKLLLWKGLGGLVFIILISVFGALLRFFRRNRDYRKTLAQQESLVRMGQAARTLAHEIKNPLSALSIQSAVLRKTIPEEHHEGLDVIDAELLRLKNLSDRVGEYLRNPVGEPVEIDLVDFINEIAQLFDHPIPLEVSGRYSATILFDQDRARSVFENLIKNALESCRDCELDVSIKIKKGKQHLQIEVMDRGVGIPDGDTEQLFDPFFTTKIHGSGIGLAISRRFIMAAHGSIEFQKRDGGGTIVKVVIPRSE